VIPPASPGVGSHNRPDTFALSSIYLSYLGERFYQKAFVTKPGPATHWVAGVSLWGVIIASTTACQPASQPSSWMCERNLSIA
jgi:hypothetical protein